MIRSRRGSQAVEFALAVPFLFGIVSSVVDLAEYLNINDALVAAVASGARSGALVEKSSGKDPLVVAHDTATTSWGVSLVRGTPTFGVVYSGQTPDRLLVLSGSVPFDPLFGFLPLPNAITHSSTVLTVIQP